MALSTFVNASDLHRWSESRDAQEALPALIRRLVRETTPVLKYCHFPAGDSVHLSGWDGLVVADAATEFVPAGSSGWELGAAGDRGKAEGDYINRTKNPAGVKPAETTFVFATSRRWSKKNRWADERRADCVWKDVRVFDADDLEQWLEGARTTHHWISARLGKHPSGAEDTETFWTSFAAATQPRLSEAVLLAGRSGTVDAIHSAIRTKAASIAVRGQTRAEALGVIVAALLTLPTEEREQALARTLVVHDAESLRHLATSTNPLLVIPTFETVDVGRLNAGGHQLFQATEGDYGNYPGAQDLAPIARDEAEKALVASGIPEARARELARLAAWSFGAFRRKIALRPETQRPLWSDPTHGPLLVPALLLGSWTGGKSADREALATIGRASYESVTAGLRRWLHEADSPLREVGDSWFVPAKEDAWLLLGRYVTPGQLTDFREVAVRMLSVPDPKFDLPRNEQWAAAITTHVPPHSPQIAHGIAETVAILGSREAALFKASSSGTYEHVATAIVAGILNAANEDWRIWASLSPVLPLFAEGAPDAFLSAVEAGLSGPDPVLARIFLPDDDMLTAPTPHTGLLWALELLAWSPKYLSRAALTLARLTEIDPGGKVTNRPGASLRAVFLPWSPHTTAGLSARLQALDLLRARSPAVSWKLLLGLLPQMYDVAMSGQRSGWRQWVPEGDPVVTTSDLVASSQQITKWLCEDAQTDGERLVQLITAAPNLPADDRTRILDGVRSLEPTLDAVARAKVWNALRNVVAQHRSFADAQWSLREDIVGEFSVLLPFFQPIDPIQRFGWLFTHNPHLTDPPSSNLDEQRESVEEMRVAVVRELYEQEGVDSVYELARGVRQPELIGVALAKISLPNAIDDALVREHLNGPDPALSRVAHAVAWSRLQARGKSWLRSWVDADPPLRPDQQASLLAKIDANEELFRVVEQLPKDVQAAYWRAMLPYAIKEEDAERVAEQLLKHGRPHAALDLLASHHVRKNPLEADVCARTLERLVHPEDGDDAIGQTDVHTISELLDAISEPERLPVTRVASLEWAFLPALGRYIRRPKLLHRALAENPSFFIDVLSLVYHGKDEPRRDLAPDDAAKARAAYELLDTWHHIPGTSESAIDSKALSDWIVSARELASAVNRSEIADSIIGQMLGGAPMDDPWPAPAVCDALEKFDSAAFRSGFLVGVLNTRGAVWRSSKGGDEERALGAKYRERAAALQIRWPHAASVVEGIAASYEEHGKRVDEWSAISDLDE